MLGGRARLLLKKQKKNGNKQQIERTEHILLERVTKFLWMAQVLTPKHR